MDHLKICINSLSVNERSAVYVLSLFGGGEVEESLSKRMVELIERENRSWKVDYVSSVNQELTRTG